MATLFLARHGESVWGAPQVSAWGAEVAERYCGWTDVELSETGRQQAEVFARRLKNEKIAAVFSSDLRRSVQTAQFVADALGLSVFASPLIREQNYGEWEGLTPGEIDVRWPDVFAARNASPGDVRPPDGESYGDVWLRVEPMWDEVVQRAQSDNVLVVAHRGTNRIILSQVLHAPLNHARRIHQSAACVNIIEVSRERVSVRAINDCCHLIPSAAT